jgi:hypothetical protein
MRPPLASRKNQRPVAFLLADAAGFGLEVWVFIGFSFGLSVTANPFSLG